ncbi:MAG: hypothetical protein ACYCYR_16480 [Desulfobulbaceae bacterium]|jgi:hypothetical protein
MKQQTLHLAAALIIVLFSAGQVFAAARAFPQAGGALQAKNNALHILANRVMKAETAKIMSVLEKRIEDPKVLAKTREKLHILPADEIRLVSSLCERISDEGQTAQAEIVFSLVTALIVLS